MILVNSAAAMFFDARAPVYSTLLHSHWNGLTLADIVFPAFVLMVGVSIPIALDRERAEGTINLQRIVWRTIRLFLIGLLLTNLAWLEHFTAHPWRFWGVLQRISLVYGACALLYLKCGQRLRMAMIVVALLLYWPLVLLPALDGGATDIWSRGLNFAGSLDRVMFGAGGHIYVPGPAGYDPEGLLGTIPAIAQGLIGIAIGERLARREANVTKQLAISGGAMVVSGLAWSILFPIVKDVWSSTFVLVTSGITILALAVLHVALDDERTDRGPWFVDVTAAFGVNAIAAYVIHQLSSSVVVWDAMLISYRLALPIVRAALASLVPVVLYIALIGWAVVWLRRRNWIFKV